MVTKSKTRVKLKKREALELSNMKVELRPVYKDAAFKFIKEHHRHHDVPVGGLWWHGLHDENGSLVGVAIVGRPVSRNLDDGLTVEITRLCTLGHAQACSMLYGAARRAADAKGYRRGVTYILESEFATSKGASCRAAGLKYLGRTGNTLGWDTPSRRRTSEWLGTKYRFGWGEWPRFETADLDSDWASLVGD